MRQPEGEPCGGQCGVEAVVSAVEASGAVTGGHAGGRGRDLATHLLFLCAFLPTPYCSEENRRVRKARWCGQYHIYSVF